MAHPIAHTNPATPAKAGARGKVDPGLRRESADGTSSCIKRMNLCTTIGGHVVITLSDARRVIAAAEAKAHEIGQPMNIAVVDAGGNLMSHVRMDGAWIGSFDISINKAFTARAFDIEAA